MTPDYALALTLNGLRLLSRGTDTWTLLGEVPVDSPDLGAELTALREKAGLEGRVPVSVFLPEEQIKFMQINGLLEDRETIESAVSAATPYALNELSYDVETANGVTYLAIVALETLDEVESFASHYDFEPRDYSAIVAEESFPRAPVFNTLGQAFEQPAPQALAVEEIQPQCVEESVVAAPIEEPIVSEEPIVEEAPLVLQEPIIEEIEPSIEEPLLVEEPVVVQETVVEAEPEVLPEALPVQVEDEPPAVVEPVAAPVQVIAEPEPVFSTIQAPAELRAEPSIAAPRPLVAERPALVAEPRAQQLAAPTRVNSAKAAALFSRKPEPVKAEPSLFSRPAPDAPKQPTLAATRGIEAPVLRGPQLSSQRNLASFAAQMPHDEPAPFVEAEADQSARKPRYTALILTIVLLLFMIAIALFSPAGKSVSTWLGEPTGPTHQISEVQLAAETTKTGEAKSLPIPQSAASAAVAAADAALPATAPETTATAAITSSTTAPEMTRQSLAPPPVVGALASQEEAESFYSSTGVWIKAARPNVPVEDDRPQALVSLSAATPLAQEPVPPALNQSIPLATPTPQAPPPAAGERLPRDPRGFVLATPEGTRMPDGMMIYQGRPSVLPPNRPQEPETLGEASPRSATLPLASAPETTLAQAETALTQALFFNAPSPRARPGDIAAAAQSSEIVGYDGQSAPKRPQRRPGDIAAPAAASEATAAYQGRRPQARPGDVAPSALPDVDVTAALAAIVTEPSSGSAPRRPAARPSNFSQVVAQQNAADDAAKRAEAEAEERRLAERETTRQNAQRAAAVEQTAAQILANMPVPPAEVRERVTEEEAEEHDEVVVPASPTGRVPQTVAQNATVANAMNLRQINLIGVFGRANDRRAIVRLPNGRMQTVRVGDALDGGQVTAISNNVINYVKRGRTYALQVAGGA